MYKVNYYIYIYAFEYFSNNENGSQKIQYKLFIEFEVEIRTPKLVEI